MKRNHLLFALGAGVIALTFSSYTSGPQQGGAGNHTGSAGSQANCSTGSGCHATNTANTTVAIGITTQAGGLVSSYTPGASYKIVITGGNTNASLPRFGFQASCVKAGATSTQAGTFASTASNISVRTASGLQLVEHNTQLPAVASSGTNNVYQASFNWTAPAAGTGTVRFYATLNAVNNNGASSGDQPNTASPLDFPESSGTGVADVKALQLRVYPNPTATALHIALPAGAGKIERVAVMDVTGRIAPMAVAQVQDGLLLDVHALAAGNYQLSLVKDGQLCSARFTKQ